MTSLIRAGLRRLALNSRRAHSGALGPPVRGVAIWDAILRSVDDEIVLGKTSRGICKVSIDQEAPHILLAAGTGTPEDARTLARARSGGDHVV